MIYHLIANAFLLYCHSKSQPEMLSVTTNVLYLSYRYSYLKVGMQAFPVQRG